MAQAGVTCDTRGLEPVSKGLGEAGRALAEDGSGVRLRNAAGTAGAQLLGELRASAATSPTPQARLVAEAMRVEKGAEVSVVVGGSRPVGSRGTPAGVLVWGSEHGGENFGASAGGSYWIQPAVDRYADSGADQVYSEACDNILRDAGLL